MKDGLKDAIILSLDTDQDCFFGRYEKEELSEFFIEMMKRFEYEMLSLQPKIL